MYRTSLFKIVAFFILVFMGVGTPFVWAEVPSQIQLDVTFVDDGVPIEGKKSVTVFLYSGDSETQLWTQQLTDVSFVSGNATLILGETDPIPDSYFENSKLKFGVRVNQQEIKIPIVSVPYSMRSEKANDAYRLEDEDVMYFDDDNTRIGLGNRTPNATLDVSGGVKIGKIRDNIQPTAGMIQWSGFDFLGRVGDEWKSFSQNTNDVDASKWDVVTGGITVDTTKNVGIGTTSPIYKLDVHGKAVIYGELKADLGMTIDGDLKIQDTYYFSNAGAISAASVKLSTANTWVSGNMTFSGSLNGDGSQLYGISSSGITDGTMSQVKFKEGAITGTHISPNAIVSTNILDHQIGQVKFADAAIQTHHIANNTFTSSQIATESVTSTKLVKGFINTSDIPNGWISDSKLATGSILTDRMVDGAVTTAKLADATIQSEDIATDAVTGNFILANSVSSANIADDAIPLSDIGATLAISNGGTGITSVTNKAVLFADETGIKEDASHLVWDTSQKRLGVGLIDPSSIFHIQKSAGQNTFLIETTGNLKVGVQLKNASANWEVGAQIDGYLDIRNNADATAYLQINDTGHLGVGIYDPKETLDVTGGITIGEATSNIAGAIQYKEQQFLVNQTGTTTWNEISSRFNGKSYGSGLSVAGGMASGNVIGGGQSNTMTGYVSAMLSGSQNVSIGRYNFLGGGESNQVTGNYNMIIGGFENIITGNYDVIVGGYQNQVTGNHSTIGGGSGNIIHADHAVIPGGTTNNVSASYSAVGGGENNQVAGSWSTIVGGRNNVISTTENNTVKGGDGGLSVIVGGQNNTIAGAFNMIGGGQGHTVTGRHNLVIGGVNQRVQGRLSAVLGGKDNQASGLNQIIGGGVRNQVEGKLNAVAAGVENRVSGHGSVIASGQKNTIKGYGNTVSGGAGHRVTGELNMVGGGQKHTVAGRGNVIQVGDNNQVQGNYNSILAGNDNQVSGRGSTIIAGEGNRVTGEGSLAGGSDNTVKQKGSFVWVDQSQEEGVRTDKKNQFIVRATGGVTFYTGDNSGVKLEDGSWAYVSDVTQKTKIRAVDLKTVGEKVKQLPMMYWEYRAEPGVKHLGPTSQDFYDAFGLGIDRKHITAIDADGVMLAAVQYGKMRFDAEMKNIEALIQKRKVIEKQLSIPHHLTDDLQTLYREVADQSRQFDYIQTQLERQHETYLQLKRNTHIQWVKLILKEMTVSVMGIIVLAAVMLFAGGAVGWLLSNRSKLFRWMLIGGLFLVLSTPICFAKAFPIYLNVEIQAADGETPITGFQTVDVSIISPSGDVQWTETKEDIPFLGGVAGFKVGDETRIESIDVEEVGTKIQIEIQNATQNVTLYSIPFSMFSYGTDLADTIYNDGLFKIDHSEEEVSVGSNTALAKLDIAGGLIVGQTETTLNGTLRVNGGRLQGYKISEWVNLDFEEDPSFASKWQITTTNISTTYNRVGIGTSSPQDTLDVRGQVRITGDVSVQDVTISSGNVIIGSSYRFETTGLVLANSITLTPSSNTWTSSTLNISGQFSGDGSGLTGLVSDTLATGAVTVSDIKDNTLISAKIADQTVSSINIADQAIVSAKLATGINIETSKLADGAITGDKIKDRAIKASDMSDGFVLGTDALSDGAITGDKMANLAVISAKITDNAVTTAKIATNAVTTAKLADGAVASFNIKDGVVLSSHIAENAITGSKLQAAFTVPNGGTGSRSIPSKAVIYSTSTQIVGDSDFVWDNSQSYFGIGESTPNHRVHIKGSNPYLIIETRDTSQANLSFKSPRGEWSAHVDSNNQFRIQNITESKFPLMINNSGNMGILTNPSAERLTVGGAIKVRQAAGSSPSEGTLHYTGSVFQGRVGNTWVTLGAAPIWGGIGYGSDNKAGSTHAGVLGGISNQAMGDNAFIGGGQSNIVLSTAADSVIGGGESNVVSQNTSIEKSMIGGGKSHRVQQSYSAIGGGENHSITQTYGFILGGESHQAAGSYASIWGGQDSHVSSTGQGNTLLGGQANTISAGSYNTIVGGNNNQITSGDHQVWGGGSSLIAFNHSLNSNDAVIAGGQDNQLLGSESVIGTGLGNQVLGDKSVAMSGVHNIVNGSDSTLLSGSENRIEGTSNTVGSGERNRVKGHYNAVLSGQGNQTNGDANVIGGGYANTSSGYGNIISGGEANTIEGDTNVIGGGAGNALTGQVSVISGGERNTVAGSGSGVLGGVDNQVKGDESVILGGVENRVEASGSVAAGTRSTVTHDGSFVWSDQSQEEGMSSDGENQFIVRAGGGIVFYTGDMDQGVTFDGGSWAHVSDRDSKQNFQPINRAHFLEKFSGLKVQNWVYKSTPDRYHMGPMAQPFYKAFQFGKDPRHVSAIDLDGVGLFAVQILGEKVLKQHARLAQESQGIEHLKDEFRKRGLSNSERPHEKALREAVTKKSNQETQVVSMIKSQKDRFDTLNGRLSQLKSRAQKLKEARTIQETRP